MQNEVCFDLHGLVDVGNPAVDITAQRRRVVPLACQIAERSAVNKGPYRSAVCSVLVLRKGVRASPASHEGDLENR